MSDALTCLCPRRAGWSGTRSATPSKSLYAWPPLASKTQGSPCCSGLEHAVNKEGRCTNLEVFGLSIDKLIGITSQAQHVQCATYRGKSE